MRSIPQSTPFSYASFPAVLLLPAPHIAGLLPAHCPEPQAETFTYTNSRLADLTAEQHEKLFNVTQTLLDVTVSFLLGDVNADAFRAAEVLFHRAAGGPPSTRPLNPERYRAERDADLLDWLVTAARRRNGEAVAYGEA